MGGHPVLHVDRSHPRHCLLQRSIPEKRTGGQIRPGQKNAQRTNEIFLHCDGIIGKTCAASFRTSFLNIAINSRIYLADMFAMSTALDYFGSKNCDVSSAGDNVLTNERYFENTRPAISWIKSNRLKIATF